MPLIRSTPVPASAADALPADLPGLAAALRSLDAETRWQAARELASHPGAARLLGEALRAEPDARVREAGFTSLARLADPHSVDAAVALLRSEDAGLRRGALDALRAMMAATRRVLPALLTDPDADMRVLCCDLVRELDPADATALLVPLLERETEVNVCAAAVDVLAEIGEPAALPALAACAARFTDEFLNFAIGVAMERIGAQRRPEHIGVQIPDA